jgi:hypothetical protein
MPNITNPEHWSAQARLRYIEQLAYWRGWLRRSDLCDKFGISKPQASADITAYVGLNGGGLTYNLNRKRYEATKSLQCKLGQPDFLAGIAVLGEYEAVPTARIDLPHRVLSLPTVRGIVRAIVNKQSLEIYYYSIHSGTQGWRRVQPCALAHDGYRWHVRAFDQTDEQFKDFVFGRITATRDPLSCSKGLPVDRDWLTFVTLTLRANRQLSLVQRRAVEHDYGMESGVTRLKVRKAMAGYTVAYLRLASDLGPPQLELAKQFPWESHFRVA